MQARICGGPGWATTQVYPARAASSGFNGWLYVGRCCNGEEAGFHAFSPALALLSAQEQKHALFLGPEKTSIDFANDIPKVDELPLQLNAETICCLRDASRGVNLQRLEDTRWEDDEVFRDLGITA